MVVSLIFFAVGLGIALWCFWLFLRAGTNIPTNRPVKALVTDGPYRLSRNPIYVALTIIGMGVSFAVPSLWMLATLVPIIVIMNIGVISREEILLERLFGSDYVEYKRRVRRWL